MNRLQRWRMYDDMDRSAVKSLRRKNMNVEDIAGTMGMDRKTVMKVLKSPTEAKAQTRDRDSKVTVFEKSIKDWLTREVPVKRMLELAQEAEEPYKGQRSEFYNQVAKLRKELKLQEQDVFVRFEGLPGEYCQIDWGESRDLRFHREASAGKRYFFCARLKFSRLSFIRFTTDMKLETLLRSMLAAFWFFGGVPWVCVFDNMRTVTSGRDEHQQPIWNKTFLKLMFELESHPLACWPRSGNQKGAVENLVGWVKTSFIPERTFLDDKDLSRQAQLWLDKVNQAQSQAHGEAPSDVWRDRERSKLIPLMTTAEEYGLVCEVVAGTESLVNIDANRYSVPIGCIGRPMLARIRQEWIDFYWEDKLVAHHARVKTKQHRPIRVPEHYEAVFTKKPRAQVMLYRDHLMQVDKSVASYIETLCFQERGGFGPHVLRMYRLFQEYGAASLGAACAIASEHGAYGADYLQGLLRPPIVPKAIEALDLSAPSQNDIDRSLAHYQDLVQESLV